MVPSTKFTVNDSFSSSIAIFGPPGAIRSGHLLRQALNHVILSPSFRPESENENPRRHRHRDGFHLPHCPLRSLSCILHAQERRELDNVLCIAHMRRPQPVHINSSNYFEHSQRPLHFLHPHPGYLGVASSTQEEDRCVGDFHGRLSVSPNSTFSPSIKV